MLPARAGEPTPYRIGGRGTCEIRMGETVIVGEAVGEAAGWGIVARGQRRRWRAGAVKDGKKGGEIQHGRTDASRQSN